MHSLTIALIALSCIFGGALLGLLIQGFLPDHHLRPESKDTVKLGAGLIATMAALVLGLLVSSSKNTYDSMNSGLVQTSAKIIMLDRLLANYGPETAKARSELREIVARVISLVWPEQKVGDIEVRTAETTVKVETLTEQIRELAPQSDIQRSIQAQALQVSEDLMFARWMLMQQRQTMLPTVLLVVLIFWLSLLNITYGLFAPRNLTVVAVLLVCALSVSASLLIIVEMISPLDGIIQVSSAPLRSALKSLGK